MKLAPFLFLNFSHGQEWCNVQRAAQLCNDDSDLRYRKCLEQFGCYASDTTNNPSSRCTNDRKSACWYEHNARKTACPCGNGQDGCGSGEWCRGKSHSILITRESDPETVLFSHIMKPGGSEDHFGHDKIYSGATEWNIKSNRYSCSFQLGDRMFIVGGQGSYGYDSYELIFAPPQWIAKLEKLPNLPIRFEEGSCYAYTSSDAMICSSNSYGGKECYHTSDGKTYTQTGYLKNDHQQGKMVKVPVFGKDSVMMIGGKNPSCYMEEYSNGEWNIRQHCAQGGVVGFSAINVPYKHTFAEYIIYTLGGYNVLTGTSNSDVWYWHGPASNFYSKIPDRLLTQRHNHATIQIDDFIYFIGGYEYNDHGGTIEVWELKWDNDPGFYPHGYGACPRWCSWSDIEGLQERPGGICTSSFWNDILSGQSQCNYYADTPQFNKRLVTSPAHGGILENDHLKAFVMP